MKLFTPDYDLERITDISKGYLEERGIKALLLDIDNTLTTQDNPVPWEGIPEWVKKITDDGILMIIVSNNHEKRVSDFARLLGLPYIYEAKKPLTAGNKKGLEYLGTDKKNTAVVGDQLFTDILGARLFGVPCILTRPIEMEDGMSFRIKRFFERPILRKYYGRKDKN